MQIFGGMGATMQKALFVIGMILFAMLATDSSLDNRTDYSSTRRKGVTFWKILITVIAMFLCAASAHAGVGYYQTVDNLSSLLLAAK